MKLVESLAKCNPHNNTMGKKDQVSYMHWCDILSQDLVKLILLLATLSLLKGIER